VTNDFSNTVSVIDTSTNTVVATVPVGARPFGVAVTPACQVSLPKAYREYHQYDSPALQYPNAAFTEYQLV
jgi:YVTN family beta-propeller protein